MSIPQDIANILASRSREVSSRSREVYKNKNTEIQNYSSRESDEDDNGGKVAMRPVSWPEAVASIPLTEDFVSDPLKSNTACQEESGSVISPRELTSRYSGIIVQQNITKKGTKLSITLQQPEWRDEGAVQMATAELKRYDRMREVKGRIDDSQEFNAYLEMTKRTLQEEGNKNVCIGRLHQRSKRSKWLYDTLVVAYTNGTRIQTVLLYLEGEEHIIALDQPLNDNQKQWYVSQGIFGDIRQRTAVPRLSDLPLVRFGEKPDEI